MESKLLDLHTDKSCYIIIGNKNAANRIRNEIKKSPLTLYGTKLEEKSSEKYLGDYLHSGGNSASVKATVNSRHGRITSFIIQARAIIDDCRINVVGGLSAGIDIWELAYLPNLLNNCESWTDIDKSTLDSLEDLQYTMYRVLLSCPKSTPRAALLWDMGGVKMKYRIMMKN